MPMKKKKAVMVFMNSGDVCFSSYDVWEFL